MSGQRPDRFSPHFSPDFPQICFLRLSTAVSTGCGKSSLLESSFPQGGENSGGKVRVGQPPDGKSPEKTPSGALAGRQETPFSAPIRCGKLRANRRGRGKNRSGSAGFPKGRIRAAGSGRHRGGGRTRSFPKAAVSTAGQQPGDRRAER